MNHLNAEYGGIPPSHVSTIESLKKYHLARSEGEKIDQPKYEPVNVMLNALRLPAVGKPGRVPWSQLANSWLAVRLMEAAQQRDQHYFKLLIHHLLASIGIYPPPTGVFTPSPRTGKPGRKTTTEKCEDLRSLESYRVSLSVLQ